MSSIPDARQEPSYTIPALVDAAEKLRADAAALIARVEIEARKRIDEARRRAEQMRIDAARIDALAERERAEQQAQQAAQQRPETPAMGSMAHCPGCRQPVAWDGLGWTHATATDCTADLTGVEAQRDGGPQE